MRNGAFLLTWYIMYLCQKQHDGAISALRREFEEKMELYREELAEEQESERQQAEMEHRAAIADLEDRYDNLVESMSHISYFSLYICTKFV